MTNHPVRRLVAAALLLAGAAFLFTASAADKARPRALKVLMIGNSFSICVLNEMPSVAASMGLELDLASCYIGGCSLERHGRNMSAAATNATLRPYRFDRTTNGVKAVVKGALNLPEALTLERWDVVTVQQASHLSWDARSYQPFADDICRRIKELAPQAEIVIQETWSYTPFDARLAKFGFGANEMYARLHRATFDLAAACGWGGRLIPTGTAVQLYRARLPVAYNASAEGDARFGGDVCGGGKDVFHLNADGHYLQALVWTAKLFGVDVRRCPYAPARLDTRKAELMKAAAADAVAGTPAPVSHGGAAIPSDVAAGIARLRALALDAAEIVETDWAPRKGLRVACELRPTDRSFIRTEVTLPDPARWNGRLWGHGNGGWAGGVTAPWGDDAAHVNTDLGTSRSRRDQNPVDPEILRDFGWRATHLSTVLAKRLIKAYYGRNPDRSYFVGASTGGGQAFCEAQRYPADYDGIVAKVPGFDRLVRATLPWREERLYRDFGKRFSSAEKATVRLAELAYFAKTDPAWARGNFILDPRPTQEKLDGCWREIIAADPALADREALWRALFEPVVVKGRRLTSGAALGVEFYGSWTFMLEKRTGPRKIPNVSEDEILAFADDPDCRFASTDYSAFRARGGKLIMFGGWEDLSCPVTPMCEYYDEVVARTGSLGATQDFLVHYTLPGRTHGARGEASGAGKVGEPRDLEKKIVDWVEKGVAPGPLECDWTDGSGRVLTVWPYPSQRVECR